MSLEGASRSAGASPADALRRSVAIASPVGGLRSLQVSAPRPSNFVSEPPDSGPLSLAPVSAKSSKNIPKTHVL